MKDFRPVALTSILSKCMERVVCDHLTSMVVDKLDPLQFAYKAKRGVEDACLTLLDTVCRQLDSPHSHTRILFMDFSSAFDTVNPATLCNRLLDLEVHPALILWIKDFLQDRSQHVVVNGFKSKNVILNTGVPQGCVLSPILFSIYTNNITNNNSDIPLFKYADDMALVANIKDHSSLAAYYQQVNALMQWIKESSLELNISKTKELCCGGRQTSSPQPLFEPLRLNGQTVEQVEAFRYLGTDMDTHLSFSQHTDSVYKKAQQRLFLLRKLRSFDVKQDILTAVYKSLIESVLTFNITSWFALTSVKNKSKLSRIVNQGSKITGKTQTQLSVLHSQAVKRKAHLITQDPTHPLHKSFQILPSGRRYRVPLSKKNIHKNSFIPIAINSLNKQ